MPRKEDSTVINMEEPPAKKMRPSLTNKELQAMIKQMSDLRRMDGLFGRVNSHEQLYWKKQKWQEVMDAVNEVSKVKRSSREVWQEFMRLRKEVHEKNILIRREERKWNTAVMNGRKYNSSRMPKLNQVEKKFDTLMGFAIDEGLGCCFDRGGLPGDTNVYYNSVWKIFNDEQIPTDGDPALSSASRTEPPTETTTTTTATTTTTSSTTHPAVTPKSIEAIPTASTLSQHATATAATAAAHIMEENADFKKQVVKEEIDVYESDPLNTSTNATGLDTPDQKLQNTGQWEANVVKEEKDTHTNSTPLRDRNADSTPAGVSNGVAREIKKELREVKEIAKEMSQSFNDTHTSGNTPLRDRNADSNPAGVSDSLGTEIKEELREVKEIMKEMSHSLMGIKKLTKVVAGALTQMRAAGNGIKP